MKDVPNSHLEVIQCCNVHLSYIGSGIFIEHTLRLTTSYEIFGISEPIEMLTESTLIVIGELTSDESDALKALLTLGTCVISPTGGPVLRPTTKKEKMLV